MCRFKMLLQGFLIQSVNFRQREIRIIKNDAHRAQNTAAY